MSDELTVRSLFDAAPAPEMIAAFRRHVAETGSPETFLFISTARPPKEGEVVALHHPVDIRQAIRPHRDMAPCPICSPRAPKYLNGGTLIWCAETKAIYAIGPDCSKSLWSDNRLSRAINRLRRTEQELAKADALRAEAAAASARIQWIADHQALAAEVDQLHASFARDLPELRLALARALKGAIAPAIQGGAFFEGGWRIMDNLKDVEVALAELRDDEAAAAGLWVDDLSPKAVEDRLARARKALLFLNRSAMRMGDAAALLRSKNIAVWQAWDPRRWQPRDFTARLRQARGLLTIELRHDWADDRRTWTGRIDFGAPKPVPRA